MSYLSNDRGREPYRSTATLVVGIAAILSLLLVFIALNQRTADSHATELSSPPQRAAAATSETRHSVACGSAGGLSDDPTAEFVNRGPAKTAALDVVFHRRRPTPKQAAGVLRLCLNAALISYGRRTDVLGSVIYSPRGNASDFESIALAEGGVTSPNLVFTAATNAVHLMDTNWWPEK